MEQFNISAIEESITCPITQIPMSDPVTGSDGQTYERDAIIKINNQVSKITYNKNIRKSPTLVEEVF